MERINTEEINHKIAIYLNWKQKSSHFGGYDGIWCTPQGYEVTHYPEYTNSIDACQEFESKIISKEERNQYADLLRVYIARDYEIKHGNLDWSVSGRFHYITATALQRCEAFVKLKAL